ncbi:hypothetical protein DAVIS_03864 [Mycobacterium marinum]|uniref:Uncharacterized protein n=1 Tax=Mycobacterium marinum TaxID=1781 RepID=A0A3E2MSL2_MYCMR|nr:hypothetical protein DAVIS_03864 [Mycobacterium marinum]
MLTIKLSGHRRILATLTRENKYRPLIDSGSKTGVLTIKLSGHRRILATLTRENKYRFTVLTSPAVMIGHERVSLASS